MFGQIQLTRYPQQLKLHQMQSVSGLYVVGRIGLMNNILILLLNKKSPNL